MKAIILAAGYATRLYPLTEKTPKPLLEVKGKPIINYISDRITELGINEIFVVTNDKFFSNFKEWAKNSSNVAIINDNTKSEEDRLGAVGDVLFVIKNEKLDDDLLIIAGDNLFSFSLKPAFQLFQETRVIVNPLHDTKDLEKAKKLGTVVTDKQGKFVEFYEKCPSPRTTMASLAVYFFPKEKVSLIKEYLNKGNSPDKLGDLICWLITHDTVFGNIYEEPWFDIGTLESLEEAKRDFSP